MPAPGPQGWHPDWLASLGSSGSPRPPPALHFGFRLHPCVLACIYSWGTCPGKRSAGLCSRNCFLSFFQATTIPGACLLAQPHGTGAAKPQFRSSELAATTKDRRRLSGLWGEA